MSGIYATNTPDRVREAITELVGDGCGVERFIVIGRTGCGEELILSYDRSGTELDVLDMACELNLAIRGLIGQAIEAVESGVTPGKEVGHE